MGPFLFGFADELVKVAKSNVISLKAFRRKKRLKGFADRVEKSINPGGHQSFFEWTRHNPNKALGLGAGYLGLAVAGQAAKDRRLEDRAVKRALKEMRKKAEYNAPKAVPKMPGVAGGKPEYQARGSFKPRLPKVKHPGAPKFDGTLTTPSRMTTV